MIEHKECLICHRASFEPFLNNSIVKCTNCGFVTANLSTEALKPSEIYSEPYFNGEEYADYLSDKKVIQKNFTKRLQRIHSVLGERKFTRTLELGCAYGFFGELLKLKYPESGYKAIDVSTEAVNYAKNKFHLDVECGDFSAHEVGEGYSDVFMWDVIEHLERPDLYLEKISDISEKGAFLYLTTGDIDRLIPRIRKEKWRLIHPPTHLHYFSRRTLERILRTYDYEIVDYSYPGIFRSLKLTYFSLLMLNKKYSRIKQFIYNLIPSKWNLKINTSDVIFLIAKKTK